MLVLLYFWVLSPITLLIEFNFSTSDISDVTGRRMGNVFIPVLFARLLFMDLVKKGTFRG